MLSVTKTIIASSACLLIFACDSEESISIIETNTDADLTEDFAPYEADYLTAYNADFENDGDIPPIGAATGPEIAQAQRPEIGGSWSEIRDWPLIPVTMANLPDGRLMAWSGGHPSRWSRGQVNYHAIWDPKNDQITEDQAVGHNMFCAGTAMTVDGEVMSTGGQLQEQSTQSSFFNWRNDSWSLSHEMNHGRWYPTTLSLPNGDIYTAMGRSSNQESSELWNATSGWAVKSGLDYGDMVTTLHSETGGWKTNMIWPYLQLAPNGKLFHAGPTPTMHWIDLEGEGSFEVAGSVPTDAYHITGTSLMYDAGKLIVTGGHIDKNRGGSRNTSTTAAFTVDINSPSPVIAPTGSMNYPRKFHNAVMLPTGEMAVIGGNTHAGGFTDAGRVLNAEIWNPQTGEWRIAAAMDVARNYHSVALLLPDGRVIAGGGGYGGASSANHANTQIWTPPYLYDVNGQLAQRPVIESAPDHVSNGGSLIVKTDTPVERFSLIRMASTTHQVNTDTRFLNLIPNAIGNSQYRLQTPDNVNVLLPGYWMLFAIDANGVPSVSHAIKVHNAAEQNARNIALDGTATQSSKYITPNSRVEALGASKAEKAIDGNTNGNWYQASVTHTNTEAKPWWQVDLGQLSEIQSITLYNRSDCCAQRLKDFYVFVSRTPLANRSLEQLVADDDVWRHHVEGVVGTSIDIDVGGGTGRYVKVQLRNSDTLSLAEVEVIGKHIGSLDIVDTQSISSLTDQDWREIRFGVPFDTPPVVIAGALTNRDAEPADVQLSEIATTGFKARIAEWDYQDDVHAQESFGLLAIEPGLHDLGGIKAWAGSALVGSDWQAIQWGERFDGTPIVLARIASSRSASTVTVRTNGINQSGAQVRLQTQQAGGSSTQELVHFLVMDKGQGSYRGRAFTTGNNLLDHNGSTIEIGSRYQQPVVLANVSTYRDPDPVTVRLLDSNASQFKLKLQEETSSDTETRHGTEWVSWMVIDNSRQPLELLAIAADNVTVGNDSVFDLDFNGNETVQFEWHFGDDTPTATSSSWRITHQYAESGRYRVTVKATLADGSVQNLATTHVVARQSLAGEAVRSSSIIATGDANNTRLWNVNPDNNTVSILSESARLAEVAVGRHPAALAISPNGNQVWVSNKDDATLSVIDTATRSVSRTVALPAASQPHGLVFDPAGDFVFVALEASASVAKINVSDAQVSKIVDNLPIRPRHISRSHDGTRLFVSHFITPPAPGESTTAPDIDNAAGLVSELDSTDLRGVRTLKLAHSDAPRSEHGGPGLPNYLGAPALSPDGKVLYVPSKQDNILAGELRVGDALTHDQAVRAISSHIDLQSGNEILAARVEHDNASVASAAVFDATGIYLFTALEGNREIAISDTSSGLELHRIDTGLAPQGLALSADQRRLYVHNFMDRSIGIYDVETLLQQHIMEVPLLRTITTVASEKLAAKVLLGKQLFYDARDERLALDVYMSCASCHNEGDHDGRVWDLGQFGEGLRNTISLRGKGIADHGLLHWSGNFDEVHDFEGQIRDFAGGTGLMSNANFNATANPLGAAKAGRSTDLDALAAYVNSLKTIPQNPLPAASAVVASGRAVFNAKGCASCHSGDHYTDSASNARHNVGTITASSGKRLDANLDGLDTPSLLGLHETGPYLHDGSAPTVAAAISAHTQITLTATELADLSSYVLQLTPGVDEHDRSPSNPVATGSLTIDGTLTDWAGVQPFADDPAEHQFDPDIDWRRAWMAHDSNGYYLAWENDTAISASWGFGVFIDIDGDASTGFRGFLNELPIGADYVLEWYNVARYTGSGSDWSWQEVNALNTTSMGNTAELHIPYTLIPHSEEIGLVFRGDNGALNQTGIDYYPDSAIHGDATLPTRYFRYTTNSGAVNRAPVALSQQLQTQSNTALAITLQGSDVDGNTLEYRIDQQPTHGQLSGTAPDLSYQPATDYSGTDSLVFTVSDGAARSAAATVHISVREVAPPPQAESNLLDTIVVNGNLDEWASIDPLVSDANDVGNAANPLDWQQAWLAHSSNALHIATRSYSTLSEISWGHAIYLDTDRNRATGFIGFAEQLSAGADYLLEGGSLYRYTGAGNNWQWEFVESLASISLADKTVELSIPRASIGNPTELNLYFKADNSAYGGDLIDLYPDSAAQNATDTNGASFHYRF